MKIEVEPIEGQIRGACDGFPVLDIRLWGRLLALTLIEVQIHYNRLCADLVVYSGASANEMPITA